MPVDMKRAPRVAAAKPISDLESIQITPLENGYEVRCQPRPKQNLSDTDGAVPAEQYQPAKLYAFSTVEEALGFAGKKLNGESTDTYGDGTDEGTGEDTRAEAVE